MSRSFSYASAFFIEFLIVQSNGNQTQGEDIADNGGIKAAFFVKNRHFCWKNESEYFNFLYYQAYQKWAKSNSNADKKLPGLKDYSSQQLFFINFAHTWCTKMTDAYALNRVLTDPHSLGPLRSV